MGAPSLAAETTPEHLARALARQRAVAALGGRALAGEHDLEALCAEAVELVVSTLDVPRALLTGPSREIARTLVDRLGGDHVARAEDRWFIGAVATILDHAVRREDQEDELRRIALHDTVTGLPNRKLLADRLALALRTARRDGTKVGVLFVDLDDFKAVNDALGHEAGDDVLQTVAARLCDAVRAGDTVARFGGDEFVVVAGGLRTGDEVEQVAAAMLASLAAPVVTRGLEHVVRASVGVRVVDPVGEELGPDAILRDADAAMYRAKKRGGARAEQLGDTSTGRGPDRLRLEQDLRRALAAGELRLEFQPFARLRDGSWFGAEALLRWEHPEHGRLLPDRFLTIAERSGLIVPIGEWTLREACRQGARWRALCGEDFLLTVNVSPRQLAEGGLVDAVAVALSEAGLPARNLGLELTEHALVLGEEGGVDETLERLSALGVQLLLDDFGTGSTSLRHLKRFPIDGLKIDGSFIEALDHEDDALVRAILGMAWATGKYVIPEGVETPTQAAALRRNGCGLGQGYLFARPLSVDDFSAAAAARCRPGTVRISAPATPARFAATARRLVSSLHASLSDAAVYVAHLDEEVGVVRFVSIAGGEAFATAAGDELPIESSLCRQMVRGEAPAVCGDVANSPYASSPIQQLLQIASFAGRPLRVGGEAVGTLCTVSRTLHAFDDGDVRLLAFAAGILEGELAAAGDDDVHEHLRSVPIA